MRKLAALTIVALVLTGACSRMAHVDPSETGLAPESILGYIVSLEFEAIDIPGSELLTFDPGQRINEVEYLIEDGRYATRIRHTVEGEQGWTEWTTTSQRLWEYTVTEPNVAKVDRYRADSDGSTPATTTTLTFAAEASGEWTRQLHPTELHPEGARYWGTFTLRKAADE